MSFVFGEISVPTLEAKTDALAKGLSHLVRIDERDTGEGTNTTVVFDTDKPCALLGFDMTSTREQGELRIEPRDEDGALMSEMRFPMAWGPDGGRLRMTSLSPMVDGDGDYGPLGIRVMRGVGEAGNGQYWFQWWPASPLWCPTGLRLRCSGNAALSEWTFHFVGLVAVYAEPGL